MNSLLKINKLNLVFWLIQFFYWGSQYSQWYFKAYFVEGYTFSSLHKVSVIVDFSTTLLTIGVLTYFFKRFLSWEQFKWSDILKVIAAIFISAFIWSPMHSNIIGDWLQVVFFPEDNFPEVIKLQDNKPFQLLIKSFQLASCAMSYICIKIFINFNAQRLQTEQLVSSLRQAQLSNLKNQINPHFLFNNLNNIRGLMLENPQKSKDMLSKLSEVLRYALRKNHFDVISIKEELKMVEHYISLSKMQFESRLQYSEKINENTLSFKIPPMIIQLLVENAIKHGISNVKKGGYVNLNIKTDKDKLLIRVENNGKLCTIKKSTGVGLKNITKRLTFIYGDQATFTLEEKEKNVIAEIKLPIQELIN